MVGEECCALQISICESRSKISPKDVSILIGNTLDHYDSAIYGFLAPILAPLFFPNYDPIVQLILAYSILGTSLVTRPIGAFIFGMIARNYGPVSGMSYSLIGIAITSVCIGSLPVYAAMGWIAPFTLILLRMVKGIFAAGESTIAKMYIMENKSAAAALKASFYYQSSSMLGSILASGAVSLVIFSSLEAWRMCFWIGGLAGLTGYFLRRYHDEPNACKAFDSYRISVLPTFWKNRANLLRVAMATGFGHVTATIPFIFMNSFVPLITDISFETMMLLNTALLIIDMLLIPSMGQYLIRYDSRKVMISSSLILALTIVPLFAYLPKASLNYVIFVRMWIVFWGVVFLCPLNFWFKSLFPASDQYLLTGMGGALGAGVIGRLTIPLCLWLWHASGWAFLPAVYLAGVMLLTAAVIYNGRVKAATKECELIDEVLLPQS